jgi:pyrroloquinoline-quinone synthase
MNPAPPAPRVSAAAERVLRQTDLLNNPYLAQLSAGSMSLDAFRASQQQFFYAVRYYPRPIASLVARIDDSPHRLDLVHNLVEEHGDFRPEQFHQNTFRRFLQSIGTESPDIAGKPMCPAVRAFNNCLIGAASSEPVNVGICCLGIIEQAFAGISAKIGSIVVRRGWVPEQRLTHYALHAELDIRHADEFFALAEPGWDDPKERPAIVAGLDLGAYAFDQLYRGLLKCA